MHRRAREMHLFRYLLVTETPILVQQREYLAINSIHLRTS
jgi:hypothetical protein